MMVYIIRKFCDSSLSQSEVKVGKILQPPPPYPDPKTSSENPAQNRNITAGKFDQSER